LTQAVIAAADSANGIISMLLLLLLLILLIFLFYLVVSGFWQELGRQLHLKF